MSTLAQENSTKGVEEKENMEVDPDPTPEAPPVPVLDDEGNFPDLLRQYYSRFFPFSEYYQWLNYGGTGQYKFENREFCFTMKDDLFIRYKSFADLKELKQEIQSLQPYKIDIGPVFNAKPKEMKTIKAGQFKAMEKELVFDIDMTDYDDIRTCCVGATICSRCWDYMTGAMKVLDAALKEDFGFEHLLWVYSGRRGVHCWVCDKRARQLTNEQRSAVAEYMNLVKGGDQQAKKVNLTGSIHPSVRRAVSILEKYFEKTVLGKQNLFSQEKHLTDLLACIPDDNIRKLPMERGWDMNDTSPDVSFERWDAIEEAIDKARKRKDNRVWGLDRCKQEIVLQYTYPRLDINVSKQTNHLLKGPFCIHPKTGRVCVPISIEDADDFNPFAVPTVSDLLRQLNDYDRSHSAGNESEDSEAEETADGNRRLSDYKKTDMREYVGQFKEFIAAMHEEIRMLNREKEMEQAQNMDF